MVTSIPAPAAINYFFYSRFTTALLLRSSTTLKIRSVLRFVVIFCYHNTAGLSKKRKSWWLVMCYNQLDQFPFNSGQRATAVFPNANLTRTLRVYWITLWTSLLIFKRWTLTRRAYAQTATGRNRSQGASKVPEKRSITRSPLLKIPQKASIVSMASLQKQRDQTTAAKLPWLHSHREETAFRRTGREERPRWAAQIYVRTIQHPTIRRVAQVPGFT